MCERIKILSRVKSGELSFCSNCKSFHLIFNNLFFALTMDELNELKSYVDDMNIEYWETKYACSTMRRKIPLPSTQENLVFMFNRQEVTQLKTLLTFNSINEKKSLEFLNIDDIDYNLILN